MNAAHNRTTFDRVDIRHNPHQQTLHESEDDGTDDNNNNNPTNPSRSMSRRKESSPTTSMASASAAIMADNIVTNDLMDTIDQARRQHKIRPTAEQCREAEAAVLSRYYDLTRIRELIERNGIDVNKIISATTGKTLLHTAMTFVPPPGNRLVVEVPAVDDMDEDDGEASCLRNNKNLSGKYSNSRQAHLRRETDHCGRPRERDEEGEHTPSLFSVRKFFENYHLNDDTANTTANSENRTLIVESGQTPSSSFSPRRRRRHLAFTISNNNDITHKFITQYDNDPQLKLVKYLIEERGADPLLTYADDGHSPFDAACFDGTAPLVQYLIDKCGINIPPNSDVKNDRGEHDDDHREISRYLRKGDERQNEIGQSSSEYGYIDHSRLVARNDSAAQRVARRTRQKSKKRDETTSTAHHSARENGFSSVNRRGEGTEVEEEKEDEVGVRYVSQICVNAASAPLYALPTFMASHDDTVTILFTLLSNGAAVGEADCPCVRYRSRYAAATCTPRVAAKINASHSDEIQKDSVARKGFVNQRQEPQVDPERGIFSKVKGIFSRLVATSSASSSTSQTEAASRRANLLSPIYERHYLDPLCGAAVNGSIWCVWLLLSHGADLTPSLFRECIARLDPLKNVAVTQSAPTVNNTIDAEVEDDVVKNFPLHPCPPHPSSEVYRHLSRTQRRAIVKKLLLESYCGE